MYKVAWCTCKIVVCCYKHIIFLPFSLPSPSLLVLLSSRNSATMVTWRHTSPLYCCTVDPRQLIIYGKFVLSLKRKPLDFLWNQPVKYGHPVNRDTFSAPPPRVRMYLTVLGPREKLWILTTYSHVVHVNTSCWAAACCSSFVKCNSKLGSSNRVSEQNSEIFWNGQGYFFSCI